MKEEIKKPLAKEEEKQPVMKPTTAPAKQQPSFVKEEEPIMPSPTPKKLANLNVNASQPPSTLKKESTFIEDTEEIMIGGAGAAGDLDLDEIPDAD